MLIRHFLLAMLLGYNTAEENPHNCFKETPKNRMDLPQGTKLISECVSKVLSSLLTYSAKKI